MKRNRIPWWMVPLLLLGFARACSDSANTPPPPVSVAENENPPEAREAETEAAVWPPQGDGSVPVDVNGLLSVNYYVILDISGSMDGEKIRTAKEAVKSFVASVPENANLGFGFLGGKVGEIVPLGKNNKPLILERMAKLRAGGGTPLAEALSDVGYQKLTEQAQRQIGYGEYHLVIITDGEADDIDATNKAVDLILSQTPIVIHTIGFHIGEDHCLNQPGRTVYKTANDLASLREALADVLAESPEFVASFP